MRHLLLLPVLLITSVCPIAHAQSVSEKQTPPPKTEKPAPLTPGQQELYRLLQEGNTALEKADFPTAEKAYQAGLEKAQILKDERWMAQFLNNLGNVYHDLAQFEKALDFHTHALALYEKLGNPQDIAGVLGNLGNVYASLGQFEKALDFDNRALTIQEKLGDPQDIAATLNNLGLVCKRLAQFEKALDFYNRVLALYEKLGDPQDIAAILSNLSVVYANLGQFEKALDFDNRALTIQEKLGNEQRIAAILNNLGLDYSDLKRFDKANHAFQQAIGHYESLRNQVGDPSQLGTLQNAEQGNSYLKYAYVLVEQQQPVLALQYAERGKGQGLALQAQQNHTDLSALFSPPDASLRHQKQAELTISSSLWQAAQNRFIPSDKADQQALLEQQQQTEQRYRKAETDLTAFEANLRLKYPRYRQLQGFAPPSPVQLAALAHNHPDTIFVEYAVVDEKQSLLFALSYDSLKAFPLPVGKKTLRNVAKDWKDALVNNSSEEPALAQKLGKIILTPLERSGLLQPKGFSHLVIVADGPLLDIPFAALMDSKGKRLVEHFAVSSAFSLGSLLWPHEKRQPSATLLCAADPTGDGSQVVSLASRGGFETLPAARREVQQLLPLFAGTKTVAYFGKDAQRERIQQEMSRYALLHFATHGVADGTIGLRSGLLLADDKAEEKCSILEARDIVNMKL